MAELSLQEKLAQKVASYAYGDINTISNPEFQPQVGHDTDPQRYMRNAAVRTNQPNLLTSMTQLKAIALYAWKEKVELEGGEKKEVVKVYARIPEIDAIPLPSALPLDNNRDDLKADWANITTHHAFVAQDASLPLPKPGSVISIKYGNIHQRQDPVYVALLTSPSTVDTTAASPRKIFAKVDCETKFSEEDLSHLHGPAPEPPPKPEAFDDAPYIGYMINPKNYGGYFKTNPTDYVFKERKNYDWVERLVKNGVNYLSYQIHTRAATMGSLNKSTLQGPDLDQSHYMNYVEGLTDHKTPQEMLKVQEVGQGINSEFRVHAWGHSGIGFYGGDMEEGTLYRPSLSHPITLEQAERNATKEAKTIAKVFKKLDGKIEHYHWHLGKGGWIEHPSIEFNKLAAKQFVSTFRSELPGVKLWYSGYVKRMPAEVLDLFDYLEPRAYQGADVFTDLYNEPSKLKRGKLISWQIYSSDFESLEKEIIKWSGNLQGVSFFPLTGLLWEQEEFTRIKNLRQNFNKTQ